MIWVAGFFVLWTFCDILYCIVCSHSSVTPCLLKVFASDRYSNAEFMYIEALIRDNDFKRIGYVAIDMVRLVPGMMMYLADGEVLLYPGRGIPWTDLYP